MPRTSAALVLLCACTGDIGISAGRIAGGHAAPVCGRDLAPGPSPIRRLNRFEYDNTVRDLLGDDSHPSSAFPPEEEALGFDNQATTLGVTELLAEKYQEAAEALAAGAAQRGLLSCDAAEAGCGRAFVETFGRRAFRRPLESDEIDRYAVLFDAGRDGWGASAAVELVVAAMLQSPNFLYRVEGGLPDPVAPGVVALTPWELATRLSYLLWGSMPDDELFDVAEAGGLETAAQIEDQARRMLEDPRAHDAAQRFFRQWLQLDRVETITKDVAVYPAFDEALRASWEDESRRFIDEVVWTEDGDVTLLVNAPYTIGPDGAREEDPARHAGILTQGSFLAANAKTNQSSPVHRGKFVREQLLCQNLPPPPANIDIDPPSIEPGTSTRARFAQHSVDPSCRACHHLMDPVGFGFEHFDGIGWWRDDDDGIPIDASGELLEAGDASGPFDGVRELADRLGRSQILRECIATQWFRFAYGRGETEEDVCNLESIGERFAASGYRIRELLVILATTDAFRYRAASAEGAP